MSRALPGFVVLAAVAAIWAAVAALPMFSETWTQLAVVRGFDGPLAAFDPALVPFRPLQHLAFWLFDRAGAAPALGRGVTFGLHACSALLVFAIAGRLGASRRGAWVALLLFLAFPIAKGLTWLVAIASPVRTCCLLWIVWATVAWTQRPSRLLAAGIAVVFVVALGYHQSSVLAPAIVGLGIAALTAGTWTERLRAALLALREPMLLAIAVVAIGFAFYVGTLQERSYHGVKGPAAVAANVAFAALAFVPEWVRLPALAGLRGAHGGLGFAAGGAVVALVLLAFAAALWRGRPATRWLAGLAGLDLLLPITATGFVSRYAYFAAALLAVAAGLGSDRFAAARGGHLRGLALLALAVAWAIDQVVDVRELRAAGAMAERLLDEAAAARAQAPLGRRIALVDAPDHVGGDDDIAVWNWGLAEALAARGASGPWLLLRVDRCWTTSDHRTVDEAELALIAADPDLTVLRFDPARGGFVRWP